MWLMNNNGMVMSALGVGNVPTNWVIAGTGDFNRDGYADILWRDNNSGGVAMWLMNGATVTRRQCAHRLANPRAECGLIG
jgi:hypothetical protein